MHEVDKQMLSCAFVAKQKWLAKLYFLRILLNYFCVTLQSFHINDHLFYNYCE